MPQNRNKLIRLFIGNISNSIIHKVLEQTIDNEEIINKYNKEVKLSLEKALEYRSQINPKSLALPNEDIKFIKSKIANNVKLKLIKRTSKGYKNINLNLIEKYTDEALKDMKVC